MSWRLPDLCIHCTESSYFCVLINGCLLSPRVQNTKSLHWSDYIAAVQQATTDRQDLLDQLDARRALLDEARSTSVIEICHLRVELKSIKEALKAQVERNENLESAAVLLKTELAKNENVNSDLHSRLKQTELHFNGTFVAKRRRCDWRSRSKVSGGHCPAHSGPPGSPAQGDP